MDKKTIFITGAANGIGRAVAEKYSKLGWFVGLFDLDEDGLKQLSDKLGQDNCVFKKTDITSEQDVKAAVELFSQKTSGKMDLLVANAGIIVQMPFESSNVAAYKRLIEVNAFGTVNTVYNAIPLLKTTKGARVVITSSSSAMYGIPNFAVYSSTKGFLRNFTEATNIELEKHGIWVNDIMPLFVQTKMMDKIEDKYKAELTSEMVAAAVYKASKGKKIHYTVGKGLGLMKFMYRVLPTKWFKAILKMYLKY